MLLPVLSTQLNLYSSGLDPVIRALQIAGVIVIAMAGVGLWSFWGVCRQGSSWFPRIGHAAIAAALLGLLWIGVIGGLISFNVNY